MVRRPVFGALGRVVAILLLASALPEDAWARDLVGAAAVGSDWRDDAPGVRRKILPADLPAPNATPSVDNGPQIVPRPFGAWPRVPAGFTVERFASGLNGPREMAVSLNNDVFVTSSGASTVRVIPLGSGDQGRGTVFADGLNQPFGLAFYPARDPRWLYVANTDSVVRFPYRVGDRVARGPAEPVVLGISGGGRLRGGGHWTRDIVFSADERRLFVSVGSLSNVSGDTELEAYRANILQFTPEGVPIAPEIFASGIRNPVGIAIDPTTGGLWTSVNERDALGDDLVPDYVTRVRVNEFYGWPWFYIGGNQDPRHEGARPELRDAVRVPDVLLQAHSASLGLAFYNGTLFPAEYRKQLFVAEHGSWNRSQRTGSKVIIVEMSNGQATGWYRDFMTGFVTPAGESWGRPASIAVTQGGSLLVSDDAGNVIWRVRR